MFLIAGAMQQNCNALPGITVRCGAVATNWNWQVHVDRWGLSAPSAACGARRIVVPVALLKPDLFQEQIHQQAAKPRIFKLKFGNTLSWSEFPFKSRNLLRPRRFGPNLA